MMTTMTTRDEAPQSLKDAPTRRPWVFYQEWRQLYYINFPVDAAELRALVPKGIEIDTFEGDAYVSIVPFVAGAMHVRDLPSIPGFRTWSQVNLRTYARVGAERGVYFFNTYCHSPIAAWMGQHVGHIDLLNAQVAIAREGEASVVACRREEEPGAAVLSARCRPTGEAFEAAPGSFDAFVTGRFSAFSAASDGAIRRLDIQHPAFTLRRAEIDIVECTLSAASGIRIGDRPARSHAVVGMTPVFAWLPVTLPGGG